MDLKTVIDSAPTLKKPRRTFTAEFKHQLIQQCQQPDTSVAKVAMQHQINANLLHKWIRQSRSMPPALKTPSIPQTDFLPVILHPTPVKQEALYHLCQRRKLSLISGFHYMRHQVPQGIR
ncbi:transposase [Acinetobacter baumannii]|uniref:transposase n=1 Tax=Acinetobacter baumannii TaxID=470 RepID=UPI0004614EFC|nr:transposase [Acinetobacter baumannii]KCX28879.1 transposase family protein [Acinetobacter baumannii 916567]